MSQSYIHPCYSVRLIHLNEGFRYVVFWRSQLEAEDRSRDITKRLLGNSYYRSFGTKEEAIAHANATMATTEFRELLWAVNDLSKELKEEIGHAVFFPMPS